MKRLFTLLLLGLLLCPDWAHAQDSTTYRTAELWVTQNLQTGTFTVVHHPTQKRYERLKFVRPIYPQLQILDADNRLFYLDTDGDLREQLIARLGYCGSVGHFTLSVQRTTDSITVFEDETFYDSQNQIPPEQQLSISLDEADSVVFINGRTTFNFTENFGIDIHISDPRMVILVKNGQFFLQDQPELRFDAIDFSHYRHSLKTKKDNRYGILGIVAPKYKHIDRFEHYLAKAQKEDSNIVYIDLEGNEY